MPIDIRSKKLSSTLFISVWHFLQISFMSEGSSISLLGLTIRVQAQLGHLYL